MKITKKIIFIYILLSMVLLNQTIAQDLENIKDEKPFDISGSFSIGSVLYGTSRAVDLRAPFSYIINGSPTISLYGIKIPLSFTYSDKQLSNIKPFQRYGASPTYKWIKLHLGHRNLNFTPYSMNGQTFLGAGLELSPGKFRLLTFYGKFENIFTTRNPFELGVLPEDTFDRFGYGLKIGFESEKLNFNISFLKIEDRTKSNNLTVTDALSIKPKDNIVISPSLNVTLFKRFTLKGTISASVLTHNKSAGLGILEDAIIDPFSSIITINQSTKLALAGDVSGSFDYKNFGVGLKYQRIEPLYESLGLYGITNDFENYTVNANVSLFKQKLQLRTTQGYQTNNLKNIRQVTNVRTISSYNLNLALKKGLTINAQYSDFQSDQEAGYIEVNDSIRLALVSRTGSINTSYRWKNKNVGHSVSIFVNTQNYKDLNDSNNLSLDNVSTSGNINYHIKMKSKNLSLRSALNYSSYDSNQQTTDRIGLSLNASKKFLDKKMRLKIGLSFQNSKVDNQDDGSVLKGNIGLSHKINKNNSISIRTSIINRNSIIKEAFTDYRGRISYTSRF